MVYLWAQSCFNSFLTDQSNIVVNETSVHVSSCSFSSLFCCFSSLFCCFSSLFCCLCEMQNLQRFEKNPFSILFIAAVHYTYQHFAMSCCWTPHFPLHKHHHIPLSCCYCCLYPYGISYRSTNYHNFCTPKIPRLLHFSTVKQDSKCSNASLWLLHYEKNK